MSLANQRELHPGPSMDDVYTIPEYCAAEKVSRAKLYSEWAKGDGVEFFRRGAKILITHQARLRHREKLEQKAREERACRAGASGSPSAEVAA